MSETNVHPTAIVDPKAEIDSGVQIGPYAIIEAGVRIGKATTIGPYTRIEGLTEIGPDNEIGTHCAIGFAPQHLDYDGAPTRLVLGRANRIREYVSIHRAFKEGDSTTLGDSCYLMAYCHIGHDCHIGNEVVFANNGSLGGHVTVGDRVFISGHSGVHQFCRVGRLAMIAGMTAVKLDVPPFMTAEGSPGVIRALNVVGLSRGGVGPESRLELKRLFKRLYRSDESVRSVIEDLDKESLSPEGRELVEFYSGSKRGIMGPAPARRPASAPSK